MSVIDDNLLKDEKIVLRTKYHMAVVFAQPCGVLAGTAILYYCMEGPMASIIRTVGLGVAILSILTTLLGDLSSEAVLTNKRVLTKTGILGTSCNEILLTKVEAIDVQRTALGTLLNFGNLKITGTGGSKNAIDKIPAPFGFRKSLQEQVANSQAHRIAA
mgnify:FL=1